MHLSLVEISLGEAVTLADAALLMEALAPEFHAVPGLRTKYFVLSPDGRVTGGAYVWEGSDDADAFHDDVWRARVTQTYGAEPAVTRLDVPVVVDNERHVVDNLVTQPS